MIAGTTTQAGSYAATISTFVLSVRQSHVTSDASDAAPRLFALSNDAPKIDRGLVHEIEENVERYDAGATVRWTSNTLIGKPRISFEVDGVLQIGAHESLQALFTYALVALVASKRILNGT